MELIETAFNFEEDKVRRAEPQEGQLRSVSDRLRAKIEASELARRICPALPSWSSRPAESRPSAP
eukprot:11054695-Lingulodinium_polyedra.AAC.1